jgi:hypothetical protein
LDAFKNENEDEQDHDEEELCHALHDSRAHLHHTKAADDLGVRLSEEALGGLEEQQRSEEGMVVPRSAQSDSILSQGLHSIHEGSDFESDDDDDEVSTIDTVQPRRHIDSRCHIDSCCMLHLTPDCTPHVLLV